MCVRTCVCVCDAVIQFITRALIGPQHVLLALSSFVLLLEALGGRDPCHGVCAYVMMMRSIIATVVAEFANGFKKFNGPIQSKLK